MARPAWARGSALAPWGFAVATLAVLALTRGGAMPVGVFYDDGIYYDLAHTLATGGGYHHGALPGMPPGVRYPPLFPAWLVIWGFLRPPVAWLGVIAWLKAGNALIAAASVVPWARWGERRLQLGWVAGLAAALGVLLVPARAVTSVLFSEPLAWFLLGLTLYLADDTGDTPPSTARAVSAGVCAALLPLARTILLAVTIAVAWRLASDRDRSEAARQRDATIAAFMFLPVVAWFAWTRQHGHDLPAAWALNYGSYGPLWRDSITSVGDLLAIVGHQLARLWAISRTLWGRPLQGGGAALGLAFCAAGLWQLRGWRSVAFIALGGYLALVIAWPFAPDRFIWGILPLLAMLFFAGARWAWRVSGGARPERRALAFALFAVPALSCADVNLVGYRAQGWIVPQRREAAAMAPVQRWAATLPRDAILLVANDPLAAQLTGLRAAPLLPPDLRETRGASVGIPAAERLAASACAVGAGWMVVVDTLDVTAAAIASVRNGPPGRVQFGNIVPLDGTAAAVQFRCEKN
jgi:hypothetical protein